MKDESNDFLKENARYKSTIISSIVKLIITPFVAALFCYLFKVADLKDLNGGFLSFAHNHPAFAHFMTQIFTSITGSVLGTVKNAFLLEQVIFWVSM